MQITLSTNQHKQLHIDLYKQIDMLSELINSKKYECKKELENYQLLNMKINHEAGIYDPNIKTLKQTINDFQYIIDTLTELKIKIPVK